MLETPYHGGIISWSEDGTSIIIHNNALFESRVLPQHFIISRMDSFTRQMNLYGFKRTSDARKQRQKEGLDKFTTFMHSCFQRDRPHLIANIVRKKRPPADPARKHNPTRSQDIPQQDPPGLTIYSDDDELAEAVEDIYNNFYPSQDEALSPPTSSMDFLQREGLAAGFFGQPTLDHFTQIPQYPISPFNNATNSSLPQDNILDPSLFMP